MLATLSKQLKLKNLDFVYLREFVNLTKFMAKLVTYFSLVVKNWVIVGIKQSIWADLKMFITNQRLESMLYKSQFIYLEPFGALCLD